MTTPQPNKPAIKPQRQDLILKLVTSFRLKWRLLHDSRISGWLKLLFWAAIPWIIFPDAIPGPIDDIFALMFLVNFEDYCPGWVVSEHRIALEKEAKMKTSPKTTTPPAQNPSPPPTESQQKSRVDRSRPLIFVTRNNQWTTINFSPHTSELLANNNHIIRLLRKAGAEVSRGHLLVAVDHEGEVITLLSKHLRGLQVLF